MSNPETQAVQNPTEDPGREITVLESQITIQGNDLPSSGGGGGTKTGKSAVFTLQTGDMEESVSGTVITRITIEQFLA